MWGGAQARRCGNGGENSTVTMGWKGAGRPQTAKDVRVSGLPSQAVFWVGKVEPQASQLTISEKKRKFIERDGDSSRKRGCDIPRRAAQKPGGPLHRQRVNCRFGRHVPGECQRSNGGR